MRKNIWLYPGDSQYDTERLVFNKAIDKYPEIICLCQNTQDISEAIKFSQENNLKIAVKGGSHNFEAPQIIDGCCLISTREMNQIKCDLKKNTVTVAAGVTNNNLQNYLKPYDKLTIGGDCPTVGVIGYTLGGGFGPFSRLYGLACDNLLEVELVHPEFQVMQISANHHPDLFWALKGGGCKIGVVSSMTFKIHPRPSLVLEGSLLWPFNKAKEVIDCFQKMNLAYRDDGNLYSRLHLRQQGRDKFVGVDFMYCGEAKNREKILAPYLNIDTPIQDISVTEPFTWFFANYETIPANLEGTWKSGFLKNDFLDDKGIDCLLEGFAKCPSDQPFLIIDTQGGGIISTVDNRATPYPHRSALYCIHFFGLWTNQGEEVASDVKKWLSDYYDSLRPWFTKLIYFNYAETQLDYASGVYFGENQTTLNQIKKKMDPTSLFL